MEKSAVIIGGGLGGLFTGAILSKEGVKVTVIEKNPTVGGGLQSFRRFGETFDTGMHVIGGMQEGGNIRRICEYLGIFDKVHVMDVDPDVIDTLYFAEDKKVYKIAVRNCCIGYEAANHYYYNKGAYNLRNSAHHNFNPKMFLQLKRHTLIENIPRCKAKVRIDCHTNAVCTECKTEYYKENSFYI